MKLIKLNESQYKRLFEDKEIPDQTDDEKTIQSLGDENQSNLPTNSNSEVRTGPVGANPFGGITIDPDGNLYGKDLGDIESTDNRKYTRGAV